MTTASLSPSPPRFIDTAPLAARYDVLTKAVLTYLAAGQLSFMLRCSQKLARLARVYTRLERENVLTRRKLDMLINKSWRERVLKELGGLRKLKLWEAAKARIEERHANPPKPARLSISEQTPDWLLTPERMAESERLKAHARKCGRATAHPLIFRDRCKMDFEGEFRLAPLSRGGPRGERAARQVKIYTQNTIVDYEWNNIPFAKEAGFGPAVVWPAEFYAAMRAEDEANISLSPVIPHEAQAEDGGSNSADSSLKLDPPSSPLRGSCGMTEEEELEGKYEWDDIRKNMPLHMALPRKIWRAIFEDPV